MYRYTFRNWRFYNLKILSFVIHEFAVNIYFPYVLSSRVKGRRYLQQICLLIQSNASENACIYTDCSYWLITFSNTIFHLQYPFGNSYRVHLLEYKSINKSTPWPLIFEKYVFGGKHSLPVINIYFMSKMKTILPFSLDDFFFRKIFWIRYWIANSFSIKNFL